MRSVKLKSVCIVLIIITLFSAFATGCDLIGKDNTGDTDKNQPSGLESGFKTPSATGIQAAYKSDKTEFNIDDVTLDFYYGAYYIGSAEYEQTHGLNFPSFDLYFSDGKDHRILIKHVEENLISDKYRCEFVKSEDKKSVIEVIYKYREIYTIPREMFTKNEGMIYFALYSTNVREYEPEYRCITSAHIYYKIAGEKVILSNKPFE